jgi:hypothetical protein
VLEASDSVGKPKLSVFSLNFRLIDTLEIGIGHESKISKLIMVHGRLLWLFFTTIHAGFGKGAPTRNNNPASYKR